MDYERFGRRLEEELADVDPDQLIEGFDSLSLETQLAVMAAFAASKAVHGECRVGGCGSTLFAVLDGSGLHWECNNPSGIHQSKTMAGLGP